MRVAAVRTRACLSSNALRFSGNESAAPIRRSRCVRFLQSGRTCSARSSRCKVTNETFTLMLLAPLDYELGAARQELQADLLVSVNCARSTLTSRSLLRPRRHVVRRGCAAGWCITGRPGVLRLRAGDGAALLRPDTGRRTELSTMTTVLCERRPVDCTGKAEPARAVGRAL